MKKEEYISSLVHSENKDLQIRKLEDELSSLRNQNTVDKIDINTLRSQNSNLNTTIVLNNNNLSLLQDQKLKLEEKVKLGTENIIKDLSVNYKNYAENDLLKERNKWSKQIVISFCIITLFTVITILIFFFTDISIIKKISFLSLDIVIVSWLWFSSAQYSYYRELYRDYKNREVVSGSFIGFINNINDNSIKNEAVKIIVNTLFTGKAPEKENDLPLKELIDLTKIAINKI